MKKNVSTKNPYATNRGGKIDAPAHPSQGDPKSTVTRGDDLRKKGKRG
jgi:hypothetical protein